jgi:hypothetical protein
MTPGDYLKQKYERDCGEPYEALEDRVRVRHPEFFELFAAEKRAEAARQMARNAQMQGAFGVGAAGLEVAVWGAIAGFLALFTFGLLSR